MAALSVRASIVTGSDGYVARSSRATAWKNLNQKPTVRALKKGEEVRLEVSKKRRGERASVPAVLDHARRRVLRERHFGEKRRADHLQQFLAELLADLTERERRGESEGEGEERERRGKGGRGERATEEGKERERRGRSESERERPRW